MSNFEFNYWNDENIGNSSIFGNICDSIYCALFLDNENYIKSVSKHISNKKITFDISGDEYLLEFSYKKIKKFFYELNSTRQKILLKLFESSKPLYRTISLILFLYFIIFKEKSVIVKYEDKLLRINNDVVRIII